MGIYGPGNVSSGCSSLAQHRDRVRWQGCTPASAGRASRRQALQRRRGDGTGRGIRRGRYGAGHGQGAIE
jgi:hypothetical protein